MAEAYRDRVRTLFASRDEVAAPNLHPVRVYLADFVMAGSVQPGDERMTDILNRGGELAILPAGADSRDPEAWMSVPIDEMLVVVPPPWVSPPEKRVVRDRHEVRIRVGDWSVSGVASLKPGAEQDAVFVSTQPFLPVTKVTMSSAETPFGESFEVVIINLRQAEFLTD